MVSFNIPFSSNHARYGPQKCNSWWRHQMETFSALLPICAGNSPVPGEFPTQRPVTRSFDVSFDLHLNKRLSKQSQGSWFETLSCPLRRHCNVKWQYYLKTVLHSHVGTSDISLSTLRSLRIFVITDISPSARPSVNRSIFICQPINIVRVLAIIHFSDQFQTCLGHSFRQAATD